MRSIQLSVAAAATIVGIATLTSGTSAGGAAAPKPSADLSVTTSDAPDPVKAEGALTYTLAVANAGPDTATNVVATDKLPKDAAFVSATADQGGCTADGGNHPTVTCALGAMISGATPIGVKVHVNAPGKAGSISNAASVSSDVRDPKKPNNTDAETTTVVAPSKPQCAGATATIVGTAGADTLPGTGAVDIIAALAGNDTVGGAGSGDSVCAGGGADQVSSGPGGDTVLGGAGPDRLRGQSDGDVLRGGGGPDVLRGGAGPDLLVGGPGADRCIGGPGRDRLRNC